LNALLTAEIVAAITTVLAWAGVGYYLLALWSARAFVHSLRRPRPAYTPAVSLLKPVRGLDHEMYSAFASHCRQEYAGEVEILFGVSSLADQALIAVRQLQEEFPDQAIRMSSSMTATLSSRPTTSRESCRVSLHRRSTSAPSAW
jgi:ceramide glucosyltransferase